MESSGGLNKNCFIEKSQVAEFILCQSHHGNTEESLAGVTAQSSRWTGMRGWAHRKAEGGKVPQVGSHGIHWTCHTTGENQRQDAQESHREFKKFPEEVQRRHCDASRERKTKKKTIAKVSLSISITGNRKAGKRLGFGLMMTWKPTLLSPRESYMVKMSRVGVWRWDSCLGQNFPMVSSAWHT